MYEGEYTTTLILEVNKSTLMELEKDSRVDDIALYKNMELIPEMMIPLAQVGVYCEGGTGYDMPDGGRPAYSGIGIKVGIIEIGRYDSEAPMLSGKSNLHFIENVQSDGSSVSYSLDSNHSDNIHATCVTSILAGKWTMQEGTVYEGVVPGATVYQTVVDDVKSIGTAIKHFADLGVDVINMSLGYGGEGGYTQVDKEVDRALSNTNILFFKSAGNNGNYVTSPGKALSVVTVGNAETKSSTTTALTAPFSVRSTSSYQENAFLPNKPDLVAPGTRFNIPISGSIYSGSGTSFASPIVAGVAAQMMNAYSYLKIAPTSTKALLLLAADREKGSIANNNLEDSIWLREKTGAGFVNAIDAVTYSYELPRYTIIDGMDFDTPMIYCTAGQKIKAILVFDKKHDQYITSYDDMDNHDLYLYNSNGNVVASSTSTRNNVECVEYTIPSNGNYYFRALSLRTEDFMKWPHVTLTYTID